MPGQLLNFSPNSVTQLEKTCKVCPCERGLCALHHGQPAKTTWQLPRGGPLPPIQTKGLSPLLPLPPAKPTVTPVGVSSLFNASFLSRLPTWKKGMGSSPPGSINSSAVLSGWGSPRGGGYWFNPMHQLRGSRHPVPLTRPHLHPGLPLATPRVLGFMCGPLLSPRHHTLESHSFAPACRDWGK